MDNFVIRWYNQNRKMICLVILTIIGVIALIQTLNNYYKNNPKDESSSTNSTTTYNKSNYSVVSRENIDETISEKSNNLIETFFGYCNSGKIENAYNLISTECKEELYPTVDEFKTRYYNKIFTEKKSYDDILWISSRGRNVYRVKIMADLLSSGQKDNMPIEDYYTITSENGQYKLSISSYIGKEEINVSKTQNNITVNIIAKKMYIDYEIYEIEVSNNTGSELIFNTKKNSDSIYIQDENELKYIAFLNEILESKFKIQNGSSKILEIKFNRGYKPTIDIEKVIFEGIENRGKIENIEVEI